MSPNYYGQNKLSKTICLNSVTRARGSKITCLLSVSQVKLLETIVSPTEWCETIEIDTSVHVDLVIKCDKQQGIDP